MPFIFALGLVSIFLIVFKYFHLWIRISDANIYFYTAYQLLHGKVLYKDIFFTNLPLFPYITAVYYWILRGDLLHYPITATFEASATAFVLFFCVYKLHKNYFLSFISALVYLCSFLVLGITDLQPGVFLAGLFVSSAYLFHLYKKPIWTGIFLGLAVCVKLYFLPIGLAFIIYYFLKQKKQLMQLVLSFAATIFLIVLPFLIFTRNEFLRDVILYSLHRSEGTSKLEIVVTFFLHDLLLAALFIFSIVNIRKNLLIGLISALSLFFLLIYRDSYYIYFNIFVPFLAISFAELYQKLYKFRERIAFYLTFLVIVLSVFNFITAKNYAALGKIADSNALIKNIKSAKPSYIYGENEIAPGIAYLAGVPLLAGVIDTNPNLFRQGVLNRNEFTKKALSSRTVVIIYGLSLASLKPGAFTFNNTNIIDALKVVTTCKLIHSSKVVTTLPFNRVDAYQCY